VQAEEWYSNEIKKLNQQIHLLRQHINQLNCYLNHRNVYEYHLRTLKIDKVKGTLQIGQLVEMDVQDEDGIHRFFIDEIKITEVEGSGTVGVGITEKSKKKKKQQKKVTPEEANEKIKNIYEKIKELLALQEVPELFQKLAVKEDVLTKVWGQMSKQWDSSKPFEQFYEQVKEGLGRIDSPVANSDSPDQHSDQPSNPSLGEELCKKLFDELEAYSKVILVVIFLLHGNLPGYLKKYEIKEVDPQKLKLHLQVPNEKADEKQILNTIKQGFHLQELPSAIKKLKDSPEALRYVFYSIIRPAAEREEMNQYLKDLKQFLISKAEEMPTELSAGKMKPEEQSFLYFHLIEALESRPKYTILIYLTLLLCK
jgi:hypothetical protein